MQPGGERESASTQAGATIVGNSICCNATPEEPSRHGRGIYDSVTVSVLMEGYVILYNTS